MRLALVALHLLLGVAAIGAGFALAREPSGKTLGFEIAWLQNSPFPDYRVPGLFLAVVIGGANIASAAVLWLRGPRGSFLSLATGLLLVGWITIQTAIIGLRHWSQAIWWVTFGVVTVLAARLARRDLRDLP